MLGHFATVPRLPAQVLAHFVLSHDPSLKRWDTLHCHKTSLLKCWDTLYRPKTPHSSVVTLRTVRRHLTQALGHFALPQDLPAQVLGHFVLSHDPILKCWDTSHSPKTSHLCFGTLRTVPRPPCSSVGTLRTVPRPPTQVLGHFALSQNPSTKCWDSPISSSSVLGHLDHYPRYHHLSSTIKTFPKPNLFDQKFYLLLAPL